MRTLKYLAIILTFAACQSEPNTTNNSIDPKIDKVTASGRQIFVNNDPYAIKGICYHPVPKGSDTRNFENLTLDLALMVEAGINTIRVYEPIEDGSVLDEIGEAGIKVIVGIGYNQNGHFDILSGTFIDHVNKFKDHNAILFWELGNEYNYHPEWFEGDLKNWYNALNAAAIRIHENDVDHLVSTAHGDLPDSLALSSCPDVDVWGLNVYRWDTPEHIFPEWKAVSTKPMFLSESGGDSYMTITANGYDQGEDQRSQADATKNVLDGAFSDRGLCSGITLYAFSDEWWKAGNNDQQDIDGVAPYSDGVPYDNRANEEYWGIVDIDRNKKQAFDVVKEKYTHLSEGHELNNIHN